MSRGVARNVVFQLQMRTTKKLKRQRKTLHQFKRHHSLLPGIQRSRLRVKTNPPYPVGNAASKGLGMDTTQVMAKK